MGFLQGVDGISFTKLEGYNLDCGFEEEMGFALSLLVLTSGVFGSFLVYKLPDHASDWKPFGRFFIQTETSSLLSRLADQFMTQDLRGERGLIPIHDARRCAGKIYLCCPYFPSALQVPLFFACAIFSVLTIPLDCWIGFLDYLGRFLSICIFWIVFNLTSSLVGCFANGIC